MERDREMKITGFVNLVVGYVKNRSDPSMDPKGPSLTPYLVQEITIFNFDHEENLD
jgi:hypothetical protein